MSLPRRKSEPGPLLDYIKTMQATPDGDKHVRGLVIDIRSVFDTPQGRMLLEFLEVSTLYRSIPVSADVRALEANNAQSFIALDLRRILSNEFDAVLEDKNTRLGRTRRKRKRDT